MARNRNNLLERWEVAIIKAMMATLPRKTDQDILAYFMRPTRSIYHGRIKDIRDRKTHGTVAPATEEELAVFAVVAPDLVPRRLEFRRNANTINRLPKSGVQVGPHGGISH